MSHNSILARVPFFYIYVPRRQTTTFLSFRGLMILTAPLNHLLPRLPRLLCVPELYGFFRRDNITHILTRGLYILDQLFTDLNLFFSSPNQLLQLPDLPFYSILIS